MPTPSTYGPFDQREFEQLFKSHFQHLCNFARQYVGDGEVAQDITQKVFIQLWEKRESLDPNLSIKSYLFTSVKNRCLNHIRDSKNYRSKVLDVDCGDIEVAVEEDFLAVEELQSRIDYALASLPEKCRQVFELSRFEGKKYREISEELGIAQKTVEAHMSKAIKTLRTHLKQFLMLTIGILVMGFTSLGGLKRFFEEMFSHF